MEKSSWDHYVGMNQAYNSFFDNWQGIMDMLPSKTNKEINMALSLLDSCLDSVKANVKMGDGDKAKNQDKDQDNDSSTPKFEVFGGN
ncbi:MAG: hypothetical protein J6S91_03055 [Treponema sp.]|nr:hypothetical protein [Treponema sp.]